MSADATTTPAAGGISIICVFNDEEVRRRCLDRSIAALRHEIDSVEYLPIDNTDGAFSSAGAALNHGARIASHESLIFVHQDVYLHSLTALQAAADLLARDDSLGILGAVGIAADGAVLGCVRDRVVLIGEPVQPAADVDSMDEVLFMARRELVVREPLTESPEYAWHAYAVEYCLRARSLGLRAAVTRIPLTHNSLTINLERLDVAHAGLARDYPESLPVRTTCGVITASTLRLRTPLLRKHRWRYRWLRESIGLRPMLRDLHRPACVMADIRLDIDDLLARIQSPLLILNHDELGVFDDGGAGPLHLTRRDRPVELASGTSAQIRDNVLSRSPGDSILVTNLQERELQQLATSVPEGSGLIGFHRPTGFWLLLGDVARVGPEHWRKHGARLLGMPEPQLSPS